MCFKTISGIFSSASTIWKIVKIVAIVVALWFVLSYLNKEFNIFSWVIYFFKLIATGLGKLWKIITLQTL